MPVQPSAGRGPDGRRPWPVRARILATILLLTILGMAAAGLVSYFVQRERVLDAVDARLDASAGTVRTLVTGSGKTAPTEPSGDGSETASPGSPPEFRDARAALRLVMEHLIPGPHGSSVGIVDGAVSLVPSTPVAFRLDDDRRFVDRVASSASASARIATAVVDGRPVRYLAVPIRVTGSDERAVYVVGYDLRAELDSTNQAFSTYAIAAAIAVVIIGLVGWLVAGRLLSPIRNLRRTASRITASELSERIPVTGNDDISALTETVNDMLDRLEHSMTTQRTLLDDVRHELKTPITIVRGHLELADPDDPEQVRAAVAIATDELDRMNALIDDIETLAHATGPDLSAPVPTDVADLTRRFFTRVRALPDHRWELRGTATVVARLDESRILQAWLQLADNAAKYSQAGTEIEVGSGARGASVVFWVADRGPGIPEEAGQRIFERFGRADSGRGVSGSGLGLAIVAAIADAHGGTVEVENRSGGGARFEIVVPADTVAATGKDVTA